MQIDTNAILQFAENIEKSSNKYKKSIENQMKKDNSILFRCTCCCLNQVFNEQNVHKLGNGVLTEMLDATEQLKIQLEWNINGNGFNLV